MIGACCTPLTVAFCSGITVLSIAHSKSDLRKRGYNLLVQTSSRDSIDSISWTWRIPGARRSLYEFKYMKRKPIGDWRHFQLQWWQFFHWQLSYSKPRRKYSQSNRLRHPETSLEYPAHRWHLVKELQQGLLKKTKLSSYIACKTHALSSVTDPVQPKTLYDEIEAPYATPLMLNSFPGLAPTIPCQGA